MRGGLVLIVLLTATITVVGAEELVLNCGELIDGIAEWPLGRASIRIRNGRIVEVGPEIPVHTADRILDLGTATCLPGLIDTHAHLMFAPGDFEKQILNESSAWKSLKGLRNARAMLQAGFTTLRVPGDADILYAAAALKQSIDAGLFEAPRLFVASHAVSSTGGHGDIGFLAPEVPIRPRAIADGADAVRRVVREEIKYGSDWIKIMATGGFLSAGDEPDHGPYTLEELQAAVDTAGRLGVGVAAHAHGAAGIKLAVRAGVRSIEHGTFIDSEGLELMERERTFLVPTFYVIDYLAAPERLDRLAPYSAEKIRRYLPRIEDSRRRIAASRVRLAFGTDVGVFEHAEAAREFSALVAAGIEPMRALKSATSAAAELLDRTGELGALREGYRADVIAVAGNPIEAIGVMRQVVFVMKDGSVIRDDTAHAVRRDGGGDADPEPADSTGEPLEE